MPNDGFSERLNASIESSTGDATTGAGSIDSLLPGATDDTSLVVGIDTATAGAKSGTATISVVSTGAGTSELADTPLGPQVVNMSAQVNNFAVANISKLGRNGTFSMTGPNDYTLDLGASVQGLSSLSAELGVTNDVVAPADDLAGSFVLAAPGFSLTGFESFAALAAGSTHAGLVVALDSSVAGTFSGQITLAPESTDLRPFSLDLAPITIHLVAVIGLAGDYNGDGTVDAADYTVWRDKLGDLPARSPTTSMAARLARLSTPRGSCISVRPAAAEQGPGRVRRCRNREAFC